LIVLNAHRRDDVKTGYRYSIVYRGEAAAVTTDVMEAIRVLSELGVDQAPDLIREVRRSGTVRIKQR
jgi:hypothetical protein